MSQYIEPYITADKILDIYHQKNSTRLHISDIMTALTGENFNTDSVSSAYDTLDIDGYLLKETTIVYSLVGSGSTLYNKGGYRQKFIDDAVAEDKRNEIESTNLEMMKSVKDTNDSVKKTNTHVTKNIRLSARLFWVTIGVAAVGVVFQGLTWLNDTEKRELKMLLKDTTILKQQIQILQDSLKSAQVRPSSDTQKTKKP